MLHTNNAIFAINYCFQTTENSMVTWNTVYLEIVPLFAFVSCREHYYCFTFEKCMFERFALTVSMSHHLLLKNLVVHVHVYTYIIKNQQIICQNFTTVLSILLVLPF